MRNGLKAILLACAFSPALVSVGAARLLDGGTLSDSIYYIIAGAIGSLAVFYILSALKSQGESFPFNAKKIESNDALLIGVIVSYFVPFFARANDVTVWIVIAIMFGLWVLFWFVDTTLPIPLLRVVGIRFYKAEAANGMVYTLITTREIRDPGEVKVVKKISASMLMEVVR
jgi:hypothetical protein